MFIKTETYTSIHAISKSRWNAIQPRSDLYNRWEFLASLEDARVENSMFYYLMFSHKNTLIGSTVLSLFPVSLSLFITGKLQGLINFVQKAIPNFLKIQVLFCGTPISLGQKNITIINESHTNQILQTINSHMHQIAKNQRVSFLCLKEFSQSHIQSYRTLENFGFFSAPSLPTVLMDIQWNSFSQYLTSLRHSYRRQIKATLKKYHISTPWDVSACMANNELPNLYRKYPSQFSPGSFYNLYKETIHRAAVKLEVLNFSFFSNLFFYCKNLIEVVSIEMNNHCHAAGIISIQEKTLYFLLIGMDYSHLHHYDLYFMILYGIIDIGIKEHCERLVLGQTSYPAKLRLGGTCEQRYVYFKSRNNIIHFLIKSFSRYIFPEVSIKQVHAFKAKEYEQ